MQNTPLLLSAYPKAILHADGDAFFAAVEQALDPALRGRPVVTGKERGIIACASYEARALGIKRGIPLFEARRMCPGLIILPSDYETYSLYSTRMFNILRRFTPAVEEYSIDEAFADITGLRRIYRTTYEDIALRIQQTIREELGITVSVGLSLSKSLAKLCSKFRKPSGFTAVPGPFIHVLLQHTPLEKVWGFGSNTVSLLEKQGLRTAFDFAIRPEPWVSRLLHKPGREIWTELRGHSVWPVTPEEKPPQATILKSKTFTPATGDRSIVYAKLVRNVESAFMKARRHRLRPRRIGVVLRHNDFRHDGMEADLNRPTSATQEALPLISALFDRIYREKSEYRATMIWLGMLESDRSDQYELFDSPMKIDNFRNLSAATDKINQEYGKHTIRSAISLYLSAKPPGRREDAPPRRSLVFQGETERQRLAIPRMNIQV